jgi:hypothetical protein
MKPHATQLGPLLQHFFVDYLCTQKRASPQTIASYRDTFRLLLEFLRDTHGIAPAAAGIADLVDLAVIALWLGNESTETTHMYLEADLATKEYALQKLAPAGMEGPRFRAKDDAVAFLATLWLCAAANDGNHLTRAFATLTSHNPEVHIIAVMCCRA